MPCSGTVLGLDGFWLAEGGEKEETDSDQDGQSATDESARGEAEKGEDDIDRESGLPAAGESEK